MIPIEQRIKNFPSYRKNNSEDKDRALEFYRFDIAYLCGINGHGKSTIE